MPPDTPDDVREALLSAHQPLLESALDRAVAGYGSLEALLENGLGLDPSPLARMRATLLE